MDLTQLPGGASVTTVGDGPAPDLQPTLVDRWGFVAWAIVVAVSPGWATYALSRPGADAFVQSNTPDAVSFGAAAVHMLGSAAVVGALLWWLARRDPDPSNRVAALRRAVKRTRVLAAAPLLVALAYDPGGFLSMQRPVLILGCAGLAASSVTAWPTVPAFVRRALGGDRWPAVPLIVATGLAAAHLGRLAIWRHREFHSRAFDLSIYDNILFNTMHGDILACSLVKGGTHTSAHFDPILAALVPFYALAPGAQTLILAQIAWVLSGVIPVYLIARHHLGDRLGPTIIALAFVGYPSVHGIVLSDFHSLALLTPVALWMVYCLDRQRTKPYAAMLALVLLVREDAALFAVGVGVYAVAAVPRMRRVGVATIAGALAYLAVVKLAVMPDAGLLMENAEDAYTYANRYRRLIPPGGGARDGVATLLTNPAFALTHVIRHPKVLSFVALLLPLGLLPLFAGKRLLLCVYGIAFCFLASQDWIFYPLFHYTSALFPMLFAAAPLGMLRVEAVVGRARAQTFLMVCALLSSITMASWIPTPPFELHTPIPRSHNPETSGYAWLDEALTMIPDDAEVSATNRVGPHVSNRRTMYIVQQHVQTEWIVAHVEDLGAKETVWVRAGLREGTYEVVAELEDKFLILRATG